MLKFGTRGSRVAEIVTIRAIRPPPPPLEDGASADLDQFMAGDVVEFFDKICWKTAKILKAVTENFFLVLPAGESVAFYVHRMFLRVRQFWNGRKLGVLGKKSTVSKRVYACAKRTPGTEYSPIKKGQKRRRLDDKYKDFRRCACAKRTPGNDCSPIKKGQTRRRLDEDYESSSLSSVGSSS